ncbi:serine hydrolase domain-containing protein [Kushneria marisflavi]|uniref:6-aminohexanoate hydrolase n=1 Tax=Kushneria marisflavi TaxID=157779 RepID=A0A240UKM9_9GAMM|nr:serine hydrolase [Kushneria marisflavi]ART62057.1 6-aminohexanoate hydrolase [Kushneria marisflavi]RKD87123.1 CubicO group peptidase (beta-lactamase class C family) [Kushneria marisflavi]
MPKRRPPSHALVIIALFWLISIPASASTITPAPSTLSRLTDQAGALPRTHTLMVAIHGEIVIEQGYRGHRPNQTANIKSLSKTVMSALVGIAIEQGVIKSVDQPVIELLARDQIPTDADSRIRNITVGQLLSMQAGLERTSGQHYGAWVASKNWVRNALSRPFVSEPGGRMLYSTGNTHLLSAALTHTTGRSTLALMRDWLGAPLDINIPPWTRDPQGIYFGGNEMGLTPQALMALGEMYRTGGHYSGRQVVPEAWIRTSWQPRTRSFYNGDEYGYGWFSSKIEHETVYYGWGYGGQVLFVVPEREMTIVLTSDPTPPSSGSYLGRIKSLVGALITATSEQGSESG